LFIKICLTVLQKKVSTKSELSLNLVHYPFPKTCQQHNFIDFSYHSTRRWNLQDNINIFSSSVFLILHFISYLSFHLNCNYLMNFHQPDDFFSFFHGKKITSSSWWKVDSTCFQWNSLKQRIVIILFPSKFQTSAIFYIFFDKNSSQANNNKFR
jgi:hypothetical protein